MRSARRWPVRLLLPLLAAGTLAGHAGSGHRVDAPGERHVFERPLMGSSFRIVVHAADGAAAREAADRAFQRVADLEAVLSDYDPGSELSRLSATAGQGRRVRVSGDLWSVLATARAWSERTGGAFDVTVGPLSRLWRRAARRGSVPPEGAVDVARRPVGWEALRLDPEHRTARLEAPGMRLDAGGIGKGYAADQALALLTGLGFPRALVDAGGDVVAGDPPPGEAGWRVEVPASRGPTRDSGAAKDPGSAAAAGAGPCVVRLAGAALATSGDVERFVEVDGVRHSHIVDPRTGAALTHRRLVTVLAPTATEADVLASALSVLSVPEGRRLLRTVPGAAARVLEPDADGDRLLMAVGPTAFDTPGCGTTGGAAGSRPPHRPTDTPSPLRP